jgi:hypothetical protein
MEKIEIPSLVTLENKPEISERPIVKIHFKGFKKEAEHETENNDLLEPVKSLVKIVNKRKGPQYREDVFKRLALQNIKTGYVDIASELKEQKRIVIEEENETKKQKTDQEEPKKIGKKLIIRNVEFKIPEKEKKEVEERFVEKEIREKEEKEETVTHVRHDEACARTHPTCQGQHLCALPRYSARSICF